MGQNKTPTEKRPLARTLIRWCLRLVVGVMALFAIQVGLLAFPQVLLGNKARAGVVVVHYPGDPDPWIQSLAEETDHRLRAGGFGDSESPERVFFFPDQGLYTLFARLARVPAEAQGFGVPLLRTNFVNGPRVEALGRRTGQRPRYGVWAGDIAHTMAHEIAHQYMVDSIGRSGWKALPHWKQEGFPEYVANIGLIREDSTASLPNRIEILLDDEQWLGPRSWDRIHYEAGLLVEFLLDVQGRDFREILADSVTRDRTRLAMMEWAREANGRRALGRPTPPRRPTLIPYATPS